jgi:hypothetical protein
VGLNRHTIGAARQQAVLDLLMGTDFLGQNPAEYEQHDDHAKRNQGAATVGVFPIGGTFVVFGHDTVIAIQCQTMEMYCDLATRQ